MSTDNTPTIRISASREEMIHEADLWMRRNTPQDQRGCERFNADYGLLIRFILDKFPIHPSQHEFRFPDERWERI